MGPNHSAPAPSLWGSPHSAQALTTDASLEEAKQELAGLLQQDTVVTLICAVGVIVIAQDTQPVHWAATALSLGLGLPKYTRAHRTHSTPGAVCGVGSWLLGPPRPVSTQAAPVRGVSLESVGMPESLSHSPKGEKREEKADLALLHIHHLWTPTLV